MDLCLRAQRAFNDYVPGLASRTHNVSHGHLDADFELGVDLAPIRIEIVSDTLEIRSVRILHSSGD